MNLEQQVEKKPVSHSREHNMPHAYTRLIWTMMRREGRDPSKCELCGGSTNGRPNLHHTKYENATYHDLKIACTKCNTAPENRYLQ